MPAKDLTVAGFYFLIFLVFLIPDPLPKECRLSYDNNMKF